MTIPDSIPVVFNTDVPLAPRLNQRGLEITATSTPSVPVALPGEKGDVMSFCVRGYNDVQFLFSTSTGVVVDSSAEPVFARTKETFEIPHDNRNVFISVYAPDGDSLVIINCHKRGT